RAEGGGVGQIEQARRLRERHARDEERRRRETASAEERAELVRRDEERDEVDRGQGALEQPTREPVRRFRIAAKEFSECHPESPSRCHPEPVARLAGVEESAVIAQGNLREESAVCRSSPTTAARTCAAWSWTRTSRAHRRRCPCRRIGASPVRALKRSTGECFLRNEIQWRAHATCDPASFSGIEETEADGRNRRGDSKIHERISRCVDGYSREARPRPGSTTFTFGARQWLHLKCRSSLQRAVLERDCATRSRCSRDCIRYMRLE